MVEPCIRQTEEEEEEKKRLTLATKVDSLQVLSVHLLILLEHILPGDSVGAEWTEAGLYYKRTAG